MRAPSASCSYLYENGQALATIESQFGLPRESLRHGLVAVGVKKRPRGVRQLRPDAIRAVCRRR